MSGPWNIQIDTDVGLAADGKTVVKSAVKPTRAKVERRRLHTIAEVRKMQRVIFWEMRDGKLDTNKANTQMSMLKTIADTIMDSDIESGLDAALKAK